MDALTRQEYPAMLDSLPPAVAVAKLNDRVKKITKINIEIADWLQERRKIEENYATSLRRISKRQLNDVWGHMGVFESPWKHMMTATEDIAKSHNYFAKCIEKDVETPLKNFAATNNEMSNLTTMRGNISSLARELEEAQSKKDRLLKKGGKSSPSRLEAASNRLQAAKQQWDVQAAFVYESLQALDERRVNHLRDLLTQYQTHEVDHIQLNREAVESTLKHFLEISTEAEIRSWSQISGVRKTNFKKNESSAAEFPSLPEPTVPSSQTDDQSERSLPSRGGSAEIKKLQRVGTLLTRRRKSVQSVFQAASPLKKNGFQAFGRESSSRSGRPLSPPRLSTSYAQDTDKHLCPLPESPTSQIPKNTNGNKSDANTNVDLPPRKSSLCPPNGTPPNVTPVGKNEDQASVIPDSKTKENIVDDEGFSVPQVTNDPISQAFEGMLQENQPQFKLNIRKDPILEHESDAEAALSNVTNTLRSSQVPPPNRKTGTFRGRRDAKNNSTSQIGDSLSPTPEHIVPGSPASASSITTNGKVPALSTMSSAEHTSLIVSDNVSIRSGKSWKTQAPAHHPEMNQPGLNCSIIEAISTSFEAGRLTSTTITGEIVFTYNLPLNTQPTTVPSSEIIKLQNTSDMEALVPNKSFVQLTSPECKDQFTVNLSSILSKHLIGFTYRILGPDTLRTPVPLLIRSEWTNKADKLAVIIKYCLNPAFSSNPVTFTNLTLIAHYTNVSASSCQTKPNGTHLKEKLIVYWRLGGITLDGTWLKAIALFSGTEGAKPEPGYVEAKWELQPSEDTFSSLNYQVNIGSDVKVKRYIEENDVTNGALAKDVSNSADVDPFADEPTKVENITSSTTHGSEDPRWIEILTAKKLVSGVYLSK